MSIQALAMATDGSVVAGMSRGRVARWSNDSWESLREKRGSIQDVWIAPTGTVFMAGKNLERWAGTLKKEKVTLGDDTFACVWGTADDDVWTSGYGNMVAHWDGAHWQMLDTGLDNRSTDYIAGIGGTRDVVCVGGEKGIACWVGSTWTRVEESANTCLNGATTLSDGRVAFVGQSREGPEIWIGDHNGFERFVLDDVDDDELQRVAAGPNDRLYLTTGGALLSWASSELREELRCEQFDCFGVASNGIGVATSTHEGLWLLEDEWRLVGMP